jgi:hypothetical protein
MTTTPGRPANRRGAATWCPPWFTTDPTARTATCPPWCTTDHATENGDQVHWTATTVLETCGATTDKDTTETVCVSVSLTPVEDPALLVHVDIRDDDGQLCDGLTMTAREARLLAAELVHAAERIEAAR